MDIQRDLLTANPFSRPGKTLAGIKAVVIHWVANPKTTAKQNRDYFESLKEQSLSDPSARYASAHFIVGLAGEAVQCVPTEEMAYHVGAKRYLPDAIGRLGHYPNDCCVGIELCHPEADGHFTVETRISAAQLCALLCIQAGLNPLADIWRHFDITGKVCPKWFVERPGEFEEFKRGVVSPMNRLRG